MIKHSFWKVTGIAGSADALEAVGIHPRGDPAADPEGGRGGGVAFYSPLFVSRELDNVSNFGRVLAEKQIGVSTPFHLMAPIYTPVPL